MMSEVRSTSSGLQKAKRAERPVIDRGDISAANFLWRHKHEMKLYPNGPINWKNSSQPPVITRTERFHSVFAKDMMRIYF